MSADQGKGQCPTCGGGGEVIERWDSAWTPCLNCLRPDHRCPICNRTTSGNFLGSRAMCACGFEMQPVNLHYSERALWECPIAISTEQVRMLIGRISRLRHALELTSARGGRPMDNPYQPLVETQERFTRAERLHAEHRTSGSKFWHELDFDERAVWVLAAYQERRAEAAEAARLKLERQLHQHFGTAEVDLIARRHAELRFEARYKK